MNDSLRHKTQGLRTLVDRLLADSTLNARQRGDLQPVDDAVRRLADLLHTETAGLEYPAFRKLLHDALTQVNIINGFSAVILKGMDGALEGASSDTLRAMKDTALAIQAELETISRDTARF